MEGDNLMGILRTSRLHLEPFSAEHFDAFVAEMLTDPKVIEFYHSYREPRTDESLRRKAKADFWNQFQESRTNSHYEVWAVFERHEGLDAKSRMAGWVGLILTGLSKEHGGPELQYMLGSWVHGNGYATEAATEVLHDAEQRNLTKRIIAVVDIPNVVSIRVLEKLGFRREKQIEAYGSPDMYLYSKEFGGPREG